MSLNVQQIENSYRIDAFLMICVWYQRPEKKPINKFNALIPLQIIPNKTLSDALRAPLNLLEWDAESIDKNQVMLNYKVKQTGLLLEQPPEDFSLFLQKEMIVKEIIKGIHVLQQTKVVPSWVKEPLFMEAGKNPIISWTQFATQEIKAIKSKHSLLQDHLNVVKKWSKEE